MADVQRKQLTLSEAHPPDFLLSPRKASAGLKVVSNGPSWPPNAPLSNQVTVKKKDGYTSDPDEMFTKYTVAEVKGILKRLKSDADAKQEELRLMVGERYRDLLQASTSIISIAGSSQRVLEALRDIQETVGSEEATQRAAMKQPSRTGSHDVHLQTLQSLAAHLKLLLDASEHLWRLLERKRYLQAAWLFLLSRVVYHSLLREDAEDEPSWDAQGINVLEQFPLVQRQWDIVSQFRSQISHKATLSLREHTTLADEVCASLLALHFLDSLPLTDSLDVLLKQRSRSLHLLETGVSELSSSPALPQSQSIGPGRLSERPRRKVVRAVWNSLRQVLDATAQTLGAARSVFGEGSNGISMIRQALAFVNSDQPSPSFSSLPPDLQLTTPMLLTTLPSSTHFLLLPPNVKNYRPFVDLSSPSSSVAQVSLNQRLHVWFEEAALHLEDSAGKWLRSLEAVKEVWDVRSYVRHWLSVDGKLENEEKKNLIGMFDRICRIRIAQIWKAALLHIETTFKENLALLVSEIQEGRAGSEADMSPAVHLLSAPPVPVITQTSSPSLAISSIQKYTQQIRQRIAGRTPFVDKIISEAESEVLRLKEDLEVMIEDQNVHRDLMQSYTSDADSTSARILDLMESMLNFTEEDSDATTRRVVFIGRIVNKLSSSPFVGDLRCQESVTRDFRERARSLYERTLERWQTRIIILAVKKWQFTSSTNSKMSVPMRPSPFLLDSLLFQVDSLQQWGIFHDQSQRVSVADALLQLFVVGVVQNILNDNQQTHLQMLWDLHFLRALGEECGASWSTTASRLDGAIVHTRELLSPYAREALSDFDSRISSGVTSQIAQIQHLLFPLLPLAYSASTPKSAMSPVTDNSQRNRTHLLPGAMSTDHEFEPAMDLVKPSQRFGLLLVENLAVR